MTTLARIIPLHRPSADLADLGDAAVVAACATGDGVARAALFERHVDAIHRFTSRMLCGRDGADDLVQATFLAAFGAAGRFQAGRSVRSWLYGIAANLVRDHARREGRRRRTLAAVAALYRDEPSVSLDAITRERLARLPAAIAGLSHDHRAALVLVDLEDQAGKDAARALGIPDGTLWRRVFEARRAVRAAVDGGGR
jgi:RNA polymerase sigma-70 factor (ECF subfamily)